MHSFEKFFVAACICFSGEVLCTRSPYTQKEMLVHACTHGKEVTGNMNDLYTNHIQDYTSDLS